MPMDRHSIDANRYYRGIALQNERDMQATRLTEAGYPVEGRHVRRGDRLVVYRSYISGCFRLAWTDGQTRVDALAPEFSREYAAKSYAQAHWNLKATREAA